MRLVWTTPAHTDRRDIRIFIAQHSPTAAITLDELFSENAERLVDYPELGRPGRIAGTRELVAHRHYVLVYDVVGDCVRILRVLHTARQWPPVIG